MDLEATIKVGGRVSSFENNGDLAVKTAHTVRTPARTEAVSPTIQVPMILILILYPKASFCFIFSNT
jgi:hypothetical protein